MKIAFIYQDQKLKTGAGCINSLISSKLAEEGVEMMHLYPKVKLVDSPHHMKGLNNILFFFSLLEHRNKVLSCDIIQGTTYTPIAFLSFETPIVSHFGSTTDGFIRATPRTNQTETNLKKIWHELKHAKIIDEINIKTRRPLRDIADIENLVAKRATAIIATSEIVKKDLINGGVDGAKIHVVHNAIEDFWFENSPTTIVDIPSLVYLGRVGQDVFTLKLKGLDRLINTYRSFKYLPKVSILMTNNKKLSSWLRDSINANTVHTNLYKPEIKEKLNVLCGGVMLVTSRYEGFCLSIVEGMSQGLIPVAFPVGVAPEIIQDGVNGYLVSSEKEMVEKIQLILNDDVLRRKLSVQALETSKQFNSKNMTEKLLIIYKQIIENKPSKYEKRLSMNKKRHH